MKKLVMAVFGAAAMVSSLVAADVSDSRRAADVYLDAKQTPAKLRAFLQGFPKGADLHNHLMGAIYAETWLEWAAEDGFCVDMDIPAIRPVPGGDCSAHHMLSAQDVQLDEDKRRQIVNGLSVRSFVPYAGWSGHNQFFATFFRMARHEPRFGHMLAATASRAGHQNIQYLELMETIVLLEIPGLVTGVDITGDFAKDYNALMASPFGAALPELAARIRSDIDGALLSKDKILACGTDAADPGCGVEIQFLHQVIRSFDPASVFAQIILGWRVMEEGGPVVGLNLVAPEDGHVALRDYDLHMGMIDYLYKNHGARNVSLHAGELTLGLVRPKQLRNHIRQAIDLGHAKRIGHGIDIPYETDGVALMNRMADEGIMVEINLTSNDVILGVRGKDHPLWLYREREVPYALSTDDEGVSRIDLTHEYMRAATEFNLPYFELKQSARNSLTYSFLSGDSLWSMKSCVKDMEKGRSASKTCLEHMGESAKAKQQWALEERFKAFEADLVLFRDRTQSFN